MRKQQRWARLISISIIMIMLLSLLAACGSKDPKEAEQERVLRISTSMGYGPEDDYLRQQFTDLFEFTHPKIKIEFVSTYDESQRYRYMGNVDNPDAEPVKQPLEILKEKINGTTPPDVILMEYDHLAELIRENLLVGLDTQMQKAKMNVDEFVPAVIEGIKDQSEDGRLYALAPMFTASAMIYNKKLFTDAGLAFPTDDMTWDDAFQMARQLSTGEGADRNFGLSFSTYRYNDSFYDMNMYTAPLGLQMYDEKGENMSVDTEEWRKAWQTFADLKKDKVLPEQPNYEQPRTEQGPFDYHSLLSGKVAMSIINFYDISEIINANKNAANIKNFEPVDWDVVAVPTHPEAPGVGGQLYMNGIMGISSTAENPEDAWTFINFLLSEEWAKQKSKSVSQFVTWKKYNQTRDGLEYNLDAFFKNMPVKNNMFNNTLYMQKPDIWQAQNIGQMKFNEVIAETKSVPDALKEWQTEGNVILKKLMENNGRLDYSGGGMDMPMSVDSISVEKQMIMEAAGETVVESEVVEEPSGEEPAVESDAVIESPAAPPVE
jgi:multiple sugar transport system substrate-binding protein